MKNISIFSKNSKEWQYIIKISSKKRLSSIFTCLLLQTSSFLYYFPHSYDEKYNTNSERNTKKEGIMKYNFFLCLYNLRAPFFFQISFAKIFIFIVKVIASVSKCPNMYIFKGTFGNIVFIHFISVTQNPIITRFNEKFHMFPVCKF